nr:hypothetical protein [Halothermothrix orenii]
MEKIRIITDGNILLMGTNTIRNELANACKIIHKNILRLAKYTIDSKNDNDITKIAKWRKFISA